MKAVVFDTETTGLLLHPSASLDLQPRVIEIGGVIIEADGTEVAAFSQLVNPSRRLEAIITKITGLTDEDLADAPKADAVLPDFQAFLDKAQIVFAHNLPFDLTIMNLEALRACRKLDWPIHRFCTVAEHEPIWGRRAKLTELYEWSTGKKLAQTHRAVDDCRALAEVIVKEKIIDRIADLATA